MAGEQGIEQEYDEHLGMDPPEEETPDGPDELDDEPPPLYTSKNKRRGVEFQFDKFGFLCADGELIEIPTGNAVYDDSQALIDFVYLGDEVKKACYEKDLQVFC